MMKKIVPLCVSLFVLSLLLLGQVLGEFFSTRAELSQKEQRLLSYRTRLASQLEGESLQGQMISVREERAPVKIIAFWASWCTPCLKELKDLQKLRELYSEEDLLIVGVNIDVENQSLEVEKMIQEYGLGYPMVLDGIGINETRALYEEFNIKTLPYSIVLAGKKTREYDPEQQGEVADFASQEFLDFLNSVIRNASKISGR